LDAGGSSPSSRLGMTRAADSPHSVLSFGRFRRRTRSGPLKTNGRTHGVRPLDEKRERPGSVFFQNHQSHGRNDRTEKQEHPCGKRGYGGTTGSSDTTNPAGADVVRVRRD